MNAYYTHQDTLNKILESFDYTKPVHCLEFGSGDGSSSVFNKYSEDFDLICETDLFPPTLILKNKKI